jgi:hypothetical protein
MHVAWMERSAIRDSPLEAAPDFASLDPGYKPRKRKPGASPQFGTARFAIAGAFAFTVTPRSRLNAAFSALSSFSFGGT